MKWEKIEYDDASGYFWQCKLGEAGEIYVDSLRDLWAACWFSGGHDVVISEHPTEGEAKAAAEHWLRVQVTAMENALAQGRPLVDEE